MSDRLLRRLRVLSWLALLLCALAAATACKTEKQKRLEQFKVKEEEAIPLVKAFQDQLRAIQADSGHVGCEDDPQGRVSSGLVEGLGRRV